MLGKLFKHEMKACARLILPLYLILIITTILDRIVLGMTIFKGVLSIIPGFITFAYILAVIAITVVSFVIIFVRFYKNLITDEGYLMFTLPVKAHQLINSKLITAAILSFVSVAAVLTSLLFVFGTLKGSEVFWKELHKSWSSFRQDLGSGYVYFIIFMITGIIISMICSILQIYASIALGQLINGHKILGSVVAYAITYAVMQFASIVVLVGSYFISGRSSDDLSMTYQIFLPATSILMILFTAVFYLITNYIFKNKLNLE